MCSVKYKSKSKRDEYARIYVHQTKPKLFIKPQRTYYSLPPSIGPVCPFRSPTSKATKNLLTQL